MFMGLVAMAIYTTEIAAAGPQEIMTEEKSRKETGESLSAFENKAPSAIPPRYPAAAARDGVEGHVCFLFTVMSDGSVADLRIYESEPEGVFDAEATRALSRWKFKPLVVNGIAVDKPDQKYCLDFKLE